MCLNDDDGGNVLMIDEPTNPLGFRSTFNNSLKILKVL
jgi:hypothetical protein